MSITIPTWVLWLIGIPLGLVLLLALVIGLFYLIRPPVLFR